MGGNNIAISIPGENLKSSKSKRKLQPFFRNRGNGVVLILGTYLIVFVVAYAILVTSVVEFQGENDGEEPFPINYQFVDNSLRLLSSELNDSDKIFSSKFFKNFVLSYKLSKNGFDCSLLGQINKFTYLTSGWTKSVFSFRHNDKDFALKTVNLSGKDMKNCLQTRSMKSCYKKASSKMYKEYILSSELSHSNILEVWGWCVGDDESLENIAVITELCSPVDTVSLLQMTFQQRLEAILDVSRLLAYLAASPLGSIAVNDFRRQQFVLCGKILKLTDLDDLSLEEPECQKDEDCSLEELLKDLRLNSSFIRKEKVECIGKACAGYNEKQNMINLYKHFTNLFLPINVPDVLRQDVKILLSTYLTSDWDSETVLKEAEFLYRKLSKIKKLETY